MPTALRFALLFGVLFLLSSRTRASDPAIPAAPAVSAAAVASTVDPAAIDRVMSDAMAAWNVPGAALVVVRGDKVVILKGYGRKSIAKPDPVTPDTLFPLASCTKAFTSTLLAMLVDEGKLGWDDRANEHVPGFKLADPHADAMVTLRDLLCHRTGVPGNDLLWYHSPLKIDEVLSRVDRLPLEYPFRGGFDYNSIMFMAAGRAAARRGGKPWEQLVKERIADPLGMKNLHYTTTELPASADRATGHKRGSRIEVMPEYPMPEPNPAGSIHASARDLGQWLKFHLARGVASGKRLVSLKNLKETQRPQNIIRLEGNALAMNPDTFQLSYGFGWVVLDHRGRRVIEHGGQIDGIRVQITFLPGEQLGIALLNNLHETRMNQAVTNTLIDMYCGLSKRDWNGFFLKIVADRAAKRKAAIADREKERIPGTRPSLPLAAYAGEYAHEAYGKLKVIEKDDRLSIQWNSYTCPLEHFQNDVFRVKTGFFEEKLVGFGGQAGKVTAIQFIGQLFKRP